MKKRQRNKWLKYIVKYYFSISKLEMSNKRYKFYKKMLNYWFNHQKMYRTDICEINENIF